ncbi:MAG: hypothetical protein R8G66_05310 [Cytophagales bacterium]|nr:hypothetical protein [Cytophagales bacterium]
MKKLLLLFFVIALSMQANGQCQGVVCLGGDFTNVDDEQLYSLGAVSGTLVITSVSGNFITGFNVEQEDTPNLAGVTVQFSQANCGIRTTSMTINYTWNGNSASFTETVTIAPLNPTVGTPSPISLGYSQHHRYTMSTSAANASNYSWTVTGGSIIGSTTGPSVVIQPYNGSCSITGTVIGNGACPSNPVSRTVNIPSPSIFGNIAGPSSVGSSYGDYSTYSIYPGSAGNANRWWEWSVTGPFSLGSGFNASKTVFVNTSSGMGGGTLYVYAKNSCGQSSVRSKFITVSGTPGRAAEWEEVIDPVLISAQGVNKLIVPYYEDVEKVIIYNMGGEVVESLTPKGVEVAMQGLSNDIYVVKTIRSNGEVTTTKTRISN